MSEQEHGEAAEEESSNAATRFKVGNGAWKARSSHGRKPLFADPAVLLSACEEYFAWVDNNPLQSVELVKYQGVAEQVQIPKMRAMTIVGLCGFLDMDRSTWAEYREKTDFSGTCNYVEDRIYQQKVEGAAADLLNAGFIGKEIGLVDKQAVEHEGGIALENAYLQSVQEALRREQ